MLPHEPEKWRYTIDATPSYVTSSPFSLKFSDADGAGPPPRFDPFRNEDAKLAFFASLAAEDCFPHFKTYNDVSLDSYCVDTASLLDNLALHMMKIVGWQKEANGPLGAMRVVKHASSKQHVTVVSEIYCEMDQYGLKRLALVVVLRLFQVQPALSRELLQLGQHALHEGSDLQHVHRVRCR